MKERDIEAYLVKRVKALGGEVRKVQWVGRQNAPDRVVMLPGALWSPPGAFAPIYGRPARTIFIELKNPSTVKFFPSSAHERAQHREHKRMRSVGQRVEVIGTFEGVDEVLR